MKIALCVGNLAATGKQGPEAYKKGFNHLKEKIIDKFKNVDVFLHSYELGLKDELIDLYKPVDYFFENPPDFSSQYKNLNFVYTSDYRISPTFSYKNLYSMSFSRYSVGRLKKKYETDNNFKYDWVIFARYDISSASHISHIHFNPNYDNSFIYTCMFSQLNAGPQDQWFYSNSEKMDIIFSLHEKITEYFTENSPFLLSCIYDWIDSNEKDRCSCELLHGKNEKVKNEKIPITRIANGHLIYKWHLFHHNLWNLNNLMFVIPKNMIFEYSKYIGYPNVIIEQ